jgi:hypothetical protein
MSIHLKYETSAADQFAKLERYAAGSPVARRFLWFAYFAIIGLAWLSAVLFYVKQGDRNLGYLAYGAVAAVLTVALPRLYGWYQGSFWRSVLTGDALVGLIGPTTLTVDEVGIEEVGPVMSVRRAWRDVLHVEQDADRTLIFMTPLIAVAVPHGAHPDGTAREAFLRHIGERMAEASRGS